MPVVTSLSPQKKDASRYNLFIDGDFFCGVDEQVVLRFKLKKGMELDNATLDKIFSESEINKIYNKALDYLARRPRSEREMRNYIKKKIASHKLRVLEQGEEAVQNVIDSIIDKLKTYDYINDYEFARWWMEQRTQRSKPSGLIKVKAELAKKGVPFEIVDKVWNESETNSEDLAHRLFESVKDKYDMSDKKDKKRLVDFMLRRGFTWSVIKDVLK